MFLQVPHRFIRRNLSNIEHLLTAAGLAGLLWALFNGLPVLPANWDIAILAAVFGVTLWSPAVGYFLAVTAALYPISTISIYLAVLFIAVTLLGQRVFIRNLGAAVLVTATPLLGGFHLAWLVPIAGGLWWGLAGGAWMGALAAFWGLIAGTMSGFAPDWLTLLGQTPLVSTATTRFQGANSLETLAFLFQPLSPTATVLLYVVLQIVVWGMVGALVGKFAEHEYFQKKRPWANIGLSVLAGAGILGAQIGVGLWLAQVTQDALADLWSILWLAALTSAFVVGAIDLLRDFFEHPLPYWGRKPERKFREIISGNASTGPEPVPMPDDMPAWDKKNKDDDDLIQLELD